MNICDSCLSFLLRHADVGRRPESPPKWRDFWVPGAYHVTMHTWCSSNLFGSFKSVLDGSD